jgi:lipopolysaccharide transport system ATP-binding protein
MKPVIQIRNVSKNYALYHNLVGIKNVLFNLRDVVKKTRSSTFAALTDVSFEVYPGETLGIVGLNGSGKSTLLSLIAGVMEPDTGTVEAHGRISPLLQLGAGFHPELTGLENIYMNAVLLGMTRVQVTEKLESIVEFAEIGQFIDQPLRTYSSGMQARLAFSVATHIEPEILLVDEILSVGDVSFHEKSFQKILEFKKNGATIIMVSHSLNSIQMICDRVIWLEKGRIQRMGDDVLRILNAYKGMHEPKKKESIETEIEVLNSRLEELQKKLDGIEKEDGDIDFTELS